MVHLTDPLRPRKARPCVTAADSHPPLRPVDRLLYGSGQIAEGVKNESLGLFLLFYYREVLGLSGTLTGLALLIGLLSDAVTDPLVGAISDRSRSRWGRRHVFLYASGLPVTVFYFAVFVPPAGLSQPQLFAWLVGMLVMARLSMTLFHVPHMALGAELSTDYRERNVIVTTRMLFSRVGAGIAPTLGLLVFMAPTAQYDNGQLNPDAYPPFAFTTALLLLVPIYISAFGTRGRIPYLPRASGDAGPAFTGMLRDTRQILGLHNFRVHFFGSIVAFTGWGIMGNAGLHMATYFWHVDTAGLFLWGVAMTTGIFAGLGYWTRQAQTREKRDVFVSGLGIYIACTAPVVVCKTIGLFPDEGTTAYYALYGGLVGLVAHFGIASTMVTGGSMMADIADEDALAHGARREGILFGAVSFAAKAAVGLGAQIVGILLDLSGLETQADPADVPAEVVTRLGWILSISVVVVIGTAMMIYRRYDLSESRHAEISEALGREA